MNKTMQYQIKVRGHLDKSWKEWFEGLTISNMENGETLLSGPIQDQAALQGVINRINNLSLILVSINSASVEEQIYKENKMNAKISHSNLIRRRILRIHGSFLLVLTVTMTTVAMIGWGVGKGPFALWQQMPFAVVGLFQAYLLMFVVGVALWFGSSLETDLWKWDLIGLLAHLPPLAVNFIFSDLFTSYHFHSTSLASIIIHSICIVIEIFAILYRGQASQSIPAF